MSVPSQTYRFMIRWGLYFQGDMSLSPGGSSTIGTLERRCRRLHLPAACAQKGRRQDLLGQPVKDTVPCLSHVQPGLSRELPGQPICLRRDPCLTWAGGGEQYHFSDAALGHPVETPGTSGEEG